MKSKIIMCFFVFICILSISTISAADLNSTNHHISSADDSIAVHNDLNNVKIDADNHMNIQKNNTDNVLNNANQNTTNSLDRTIVLANQADTSKNSLRDLQSDINSYSKSGQTLYLQKNYSYNEKSFLIDNTIITLNDITIDGKGHSIDFKNVKNAYIMSSSGQIYLKNLVIKNANNDIGNGGALYICGDAQCILENCTFISCKSKLGGGAIYNAVDKELIIKNSTFKSNTAGWCGGAIWSKNTTVFNSTFDGNSACRGGAIYGQNITVFNSNFTNMLATEIGGAAIYACNNAIVYNSNFNKNSNKDEYMKKIGKGGAIYAKNKVISINSSFEKNQAREGGAIWSKNITVFNSNFTNNIATDGGAIYAEECSIYNNSKFTSNLAGHGGAIYAKNCSIHDSEIITGYAVYGSGIYTKNKCSVYHSTFKDNAKPVFSSDTFCCENIFYCEKGGAICSENEVICNKSTFTGNNAKQGGAISAKNKCLINNSLFVKCGDDGLYGGAVSSKIIKVYNSTFERNTALTRGGALYGDDINVENSKFINNLVYTGECRNSVFEPKVENSKGGAICGKIVNVKNSLFTNNGASYGGAIYANIITKTQTCFKNNYILPSCPTTNGADIYQGSIDYEIL